MKRTLLSLVAAGTGAGLLLSGCGGGGGGGGFSGAAAVRVNAEPRVIDVGDQLQLNVSISDVHEDGISMKIKFPTDLKYVSNSAVLIIDNDEVDLAPAVNAEADNSGYLVFYLPHDVFGDDTGELYVELEGKAENEEAKIEIDADVDDPDIDNNVEFNIEEPEFSAEDEVVIEISG